MYNLNKKSFCFLFAVLFTAAAMAQPSSSYRIVHSFPIASNGGWDYLAVHGNRLYVSHGTQVNVLDKQTGDSLGVVPNTTGVHGIAFAGNKGFTSNGKINNVTVFDIATNQVLAQVPTGEKPDAILYEPFSKKIIVCNGKSNDLTVIDPATNKVTATVALGGKPETAVTDGKGKLYVNIENKSEIAVVDVATFKLQQHWSIAPGEAPTGLAIDNVTHRLFAGCDNKMLVVLDATNGKLVTHLPIGEECDGVAFDPTTQTIFSANGEGTLTVVKEKSANAFEVLANVPTQKGARTITIDEPTHMLYLPTADVEAGNSGNGRPAMKPGSFHVLAIQAK